MTPSELDAKQEASAAVDALLHAAGLDVTATQRARLLAEIETQLDELRRKWMKQALQGSGIERWV